MINCKSSNDNSLQVLVITGGHSYDTAEFVKIFETFENLEFDTILQPRANDLLTTEDANRYDVFVFYDLWKTITAQQKEAYLSLLEKGKGMVFLHHSLVSYQDWPEFINIIGGKYKKPKFKGDTVDLSTFKHDIEMEVEIINHDHPATENMKNFIIHDEGYMNIERLDTVEPLLLTNHEYSTKIISWCHKYQKSKIVYILLGHDSRAYKNQNYQKLIIKAIRWVHDSE